MPRLSYYERNRDEILRRQRERRQNNPEKEREYRRKYARNMRRETKEAAFHALGGKVCVKCGFTDDRALQFDHINGNGSKHRRTAGNDYIQIYKHIVEHPSEYQVLCANCNWIKRAENREDGVRYPN